MPSRMNLTGERRGSSFGGSAKSGLGDFDNSSITSGILIITFPHLDVASRVPDPSSSATCSGGSIFRQLRPLWRHPAVPLFRHSGKPLAADERRLTRITQKPGTDGTFSSFPGSFEL